MTTKPTSIKIKYVTPSDTPKRRRRLTPPEAGIQARIEHLYPLKSLFEQLLGRPAFMQIKMGGSMKNWRHVSCRLLDAVQMAVTSTVTVADDDWFRDVREEIARGKDAIRQIETVDNLVAYLASTVTRLVFIQLGNQPTRSISLKTVPLTPDWWTFRSRRSVQYVQDAKQREAQLAHNARINRT
jgi:hypothetical protein